MKKNIITFVFISSLILYTSAQNYVPFPDSNAIWSEWHRPPVFSGDNPYYYRNGITNKDTIINAKTYHQIFYSLTDSLFINPAMYSYIGGIREYNKQVFFIPKDSLNEYLIYDFSKGIGDTILYNYSKFAFLNYGIGLMDTIIIADIDSVLLINGSYRKIFYLTDVWETPENCFSYWIEGIGSNMGLLWPVGSLPTNGVNNMLGCFQQNNNEIYFINNSNLHSFPNCFPISLNVSKYPDDNQIMIFPNPVKDYFNIKMSEGNDITIKEIMITDIFGQVIYKRAFNNITSTTVDCRNFNTGLYLLCVTSALYVNITLKLIIL